MINTVKTTAQLSDENDRRAPRPQIEADAAPTAPAAPAAVAPEPDIRLVIEFDAERNMMIYKMIDRKTGKVASEASRDDLMRMSEDPTYAAGAVVNTKA